MINKSNILIHRTRIGKDIVAEFAIPLSKKHQKERRVVIFAGGMPSGSSRNAYIEFLARKGFYVINPRYRGTWESRGQFLKEEPTEDIRYVIEHLDKPLVDFWDEREFQFPKNPKIYIFASSFGGPAGILLSKHEKVNKVIALCSVVDWRMKSKDEPLDWLFGFVKKAYGEGYRMSKKDWKKLGVTSFYNPMLQLDKIDPEKILMVHTKDDTSVPIKDVIHFAKKTGVQLILRKSGGHGGLSKLFEPYIWKRAEKFLKHK